MTAVWVTIGTGVAIAVLAMALRSGLRQVRDRSGQSLVVSVDPHGFSEDRIYVGIDRPQSDEEPEMVDDESQVALGWQSVRLSARGRDNRGVLIQRLRVEVTERLDAAAGWYVYPERGGGLEVRYFVADLDADPSIAVLTQEATNGPELAEPTRSYAFKVSEDDVESWELEVFTSEHALLRWVLLVDYEIGGKHRTYRLTHPHFAVTGAGPGQVAYAWNPGERWQNMGDSGDSVAGQAQYWRDRIDAPEQ